MFSKNYIPYMSDFHKDEVMMHGDIVPLRDSYMDGTPGSALTAQLRFRSIVQGCPLSARLRRALSHYFSHRTAGRQEIVDNPA